MRTAAFLALFLTAPLDGQFPWPPDHWHALLLGSLGLLWWGLQCWDEW